MGVPQFTTPTFTLTFDEQGLDLTQAVNVYVTFRSGQYVLTKSGEDITVSEKTIAVYLTQEETSQFRVGSVEIQANWTTGGGGRVASETVRFKITEQLLKRVIE